MSLHCLVLLSACNLLWHDVTGYPSGAPVAQCTNMQPGVSEHGASGQSIPSPYTMTVSSTQVNGGESITVTIDSDTEIFRGILLEARVTNETTIVGTFGSPPGNFKSLACNNVADSAVTHANSDNKTVPQVFTWMAPNDADREVEFVATIVQVKSTYWVQQKSESVTVSQVSTTTMTDPGTSQAPSVVQSMVTMLLVACSAIIHFLLK